MKNQISALQKISLGIIAVTGLAMSSCAVTRPNESDAARAAEKFPGTTLADLQQGKMNYEQNCQKCHKLFAPESRSEEGWRKIVPPMAKKAKIDAETENSILRYVVVMSAH